MVDKRLSAQEAVARVKNGDFLATSGIQLITVPEELSRALEMRFLETGEPRGLTYLNVAGQGVPGTPDLGVTHYAHEGLIKRYIASHFSSNKAMMDLAAGNKIEIYNLPQGVLVHMYRAASAGKKGELTKVGLKTFVDPRLGGGKLNRVTTEDIVHLVRIQNEEYLFYDAPKIDVAFIRGTTADELGNVAMEEECGIIDSLDLAMAAKAKDGKVFVQVKNYVRAGSIPAKNVVIPGNFVDGIVITSDPARYHRQTPGIEYSPAMAGIYKVPVQAVASLPLNDRKIIARRAAMELRHGNVVNLGYGIPENIALVAGEEGVSDEILLTIESGFTGGIPVGGINFGSAVNHWAMFPMATQFDYYNGGGLDATFLGFAQIGCRGDVNASKVGDRLMGCGGFIDISQFTPKMVFCGTFTTGGLETAVTEGKLKIVREGRQKKFVKEIGQITFSGEFAAENNQQVLVVTERCVFELTREGLILREIAAGIDIQRDILAGMEFSPIIPDTVRIMESTIFEDPPMNLGRYISDPGMEGRL
jgi:propionate CoA-transferase